MADPVLPNAASKEQKVAKSVAWHNFFTLLQQEGPSWDEYKSALRMFSERDLGVMEEAHIRDLFLTRLANESREILEYLKLTGRRNMENLSASSGHQIEPPEDHSPQEQRFQKTSGAADGAGEDFEVKMLTLVYLRLLDSGWEFYLGSNVAAARPFDDIVVKYRADSQQPWKTALLQLKRKKKTTLAEKSLLALKDDFSLIKYCDSYSKLQSCEDVDRKFLGTFSDYQFIIYTNSRCSDALINKEAVVNSIFYTGGNVVSFDQKSQVFKELCEWVDLKSTISQLNDQLQCKSAEDVGNTIDKVLKGPSKYVNSAVKSTVQGLLKSATLENFKVTFENLQSVCDVKTYVEFLAKLKFYTKQSEGMQLDRQIKLDIENTVKFNDAFVTDRLFHELVGKIKCWWKKENKYLTQSSHILLDIIREHIESLSSKKLKDLTDHKIDFMEKATKTLFDYFPWANGGVLNVVTESRTTASSVKVMQALTRFGGGENFLFVDLKTLLQRENEVIGLWSSRWCRTLVVECDTELGLKDAGRLSNKIMQVVEGKVAKKVAVLIGCELNCLVEPLEHLDSYSFLKDSCKWIDLSVNSQVNLLKSEIGFQGSRILLSTLVEGNERFRARFNGDVISQLLCDVTCCGKDLEADGDVFVPRCLKAPAGDPFPVDSVRDVDGKVVLVVAEPGMGKSSLMTHLAHSAKEEDPTTWVVHVKLNDCTQLLAAMDVESFNSNAAKKLLEKICVNSKNSLEVALFRSLEQNMIVSVDGVDEVCPYYEANVLKLLKILKQLKIKKLWVTSRPILWKKLESVLAVNAFGLEPFSTKDQSDFFMAAWKVKFPNTPYQTLKTFTNKLIGVMSVTLGDSNPIWEVPLMASMIAEVYEEVLRSYLTDDQHSFTINLDTLYLYKTFMQKKCSLYCSEKKKISESTRQQAAFIGDEEKLTQMFHMNHRLAAIRLIFNANEIAALQFRGRLEFETNLADFLDDVANGREQRGIIDNVLADGTPHFVHRTFAEYFIASWLSENFKDNKQLVEKITFAPSFTWIRDMFNRFLAKDCPLHNAVLNRDTEEVNSLLRDSTASVNTCNTVDAGGRTPLHLAALLSGTEHHPGILRLLTDREARVEIEDDVLGWRPLRYADRVHAWTAAGTILSMGGSEDDMLSIREIEESTRQAFIEFIKKSGISAPEVSLLLSSGRGASLPVVRYLIEERRGNVQCRGPRGETMLHMAAEGGDLEVLEYLFNVEPSLRTEDSERATPLHYASLHGNTDAVKFLVERGLDLDAVNSNGETCLHIAARRGACDMMELLINNGATFEIRPGAEFNEAQLDVSLLCAAFAGSLEYVQCLVEMGAAVAFQDDKGRTARMIAHSRGFPLIVEFLMHHDCRAGESAFHYHSRTGHVSNVSLLLSEGADVNALDDHGCTALWVASKSGYLDVVELLVEHGARMVGGRYRDSPLHMAARHGKADVVSFLIQHVNDINEVNYKEQTSLYLASSYGHLDVVKVLVKNGASIADYRDLASCWQVATMSGNVEEITSLFRYFQNMKMKKKDTALSSAISGGHLDVVKVLVEVKDSMVSDNDSNSPLQLAAKSGKVEMVSFLLQHVKDINAVDNTGQTALSVASFYGHLGVVKLLVRNGATVVGDTDGNSPLYVAASNGKVDVVSFLLEHVKDINAVNLHQQTALSMASSNGHLDVVKLLVGHGASTVGDKDRYSPLHAAARSGQVEVVSFLLEHVKDINAVINMGQTAISLSAFGGHLDVVKLLVEKGASLAGDMFGQSPLHVAASSGKVEVVSFLLQRVEDINAVDNAGKTALSVASSNGHSEVVKLLVGHGAS